MTSLSPAHAASTPKNRSYPFRDLNQTVVEQNACEFYILHAIILHVSILVKNFACTTIAGCAIRLTALTPTEYMLRKLCHNAPVHTPQELKQNAGDRKGHLSGG